MEQVRKWIDNLFTVLRRYASHRVFYHRFEVISKFAETLFVCSVFFLHNTKKYGTRQMMDTFYVNFPLCSRVFIVPRT